MLWINQVEALSVIRNLWRGYFFAGMLMKKCSIERYSASEIHSSISSSSEGGRKGIIVLHTEISKLKSFYSSKDFFDSSLYQYSSFSSLLRVACSDSTPLDKLIQHFSPQCCICSNINSTSCLYVLLLFTSYNE